MSQKYKRNTTSRLRLIQRIIGAVTLAFVGGACSAPQAPEATREETAQTPPKDDGVKFEVRRPPLPPPCSNPELLKAINIINRACKFQRGCDQGVLKEMDKTVDKPTLMRALRDPYLSPVHLFFSEGKYRIEDSLDWDKIKEDQMKTLKFVDDPSRSVVYVLGHASVTGNADGNVRLSRQRANAVMEYLQNTLRISCGGFHAAWFGSEALQLTSSDAHLMNLEDDDFRNNLLILNQAVHVFVFPCLEQP